MIYTHNLTQSWIGNFPNPLEIAGALNDCQDQAAEAGLGGPVYIAGHSLGGIMLETYIEVMVVIIRLLLMS